MANFIFNPIRVQMANGSGDFDWLANDIIGVLYDNRVVVLPSMDWSTLSSFVVSTSAPMTSRSISATGQLRGSSLEFLNVTTGPGLRISGLLLVIDDGEDMFPLANYTDGLDGFSGNTDIALEAQDLHIFARASALDGNTWIQL